MTSEISYSVKPDEWNILPHRLTFKTTTYFHCSFLKNVTIQKIKISLLAQRPNGPFSLLPPKASTNQSAAVSPTSPAGMGSVSLSVWCVMIRALTTVGMEVTWRKTWPLGAKVSEVMGWHMYVGMLILHQPPWLYSGGVCLNYNKFNSWHKFVCHQQVSFYLLSLHRQ